MAAEFNKKEENLDSSRYTPLGRKQYFDTMKKHIVEMVAGKIMVVAPDRRKHIKSVVFERRKMASGVSADWISLGNNLFFDRHQRVIMKHVGTRMVLYGRDRRTSTDRRNVAERRAAKRTELKERRKVRRRTRI